MFAKVAMVLIIAAQGCKTRNDDERVMRPEEEIRNPVTCHLEGSARSTRSRSRKKPQAKADAIRKRAQEQAEKERKEILDQARQEAERLRSQVVANAQLKARTLQLEHREKLLDRVFDAAKQKLPAVQKRSDYNKLVAQLLREALVQLNANKGSCSS